MMVLSPDTRENWGGKIINWKDDNMRITPPPLK